MSSKYRGEFFEGMYDGRDSHEEMKGGDGSGLKATTHFPDDDILSDLEGFDETLDAWGGGEEGEAIC